MRCRLLVVNERVGAARRYHHQGVNGPRIELTLGPFTSVPKRWLSTKNDAP
jgi:hypothetical protein